MAVKQSARNPVWETLKGMVNHGFENVGLYYSSYRAWVFDNDDPENLQRLKLIIPQISGTDAYDFWACPKGVFYGEGYGMQILPQRGDVVWVEFEGGRPEIPIWVHGHPARKEMPLNEDYQDKNCYWFHSPKGNRVVINDTKNYIHIETAKGDYLEWNDSAISIVPKISKKISLGTKDGSKYKAVLGDNAYDLLKDINKILKTLHDAMVKDVGRFTSLGLVNTAKAIPLVVPEVATLAEKLDKILSQINTLD